MTAVTVGSTTDYTSDAPDNYSSLNNQEPSSPTLSDSDLWLVDPTQLGGETTDTFFPEYSVTNLSETVDQNLIVPFDNIDNEEPEITLGTITTVGDETFEVDDPISDSIDTAVTTGNIDLASSTPSGTVDSTASQLTDSGQVTSFSDTSGGTSGGTGDGSGGSLSELTSDGTSSSGTEGSDGTGDTTTTSGDTTTSGTTSSEGDFTSNASLDNPETFQSTEGTTLTDGSTTGEPADVPFSFTESLGLGLLIGIVGLHKMMKQRKRAFNAA